MPHAMRQCTEVSQLPKCGHSFRTMPHCMGQWAVRIPLYTPHCMGHAWGRGQWAVGVSQYTASLHGAVGSGDPSVHCLTAWGYTWGSKECSGMG